MPEIDPTTVFIVCRDCKERKVGTEFHKHPRAKFGRTTICKPCESASLKVYRAANRERLLKSARAWKANNAERRMDYSEAYYQRNKDEIKSKATTYAAILRKEDPDKLKSFAIKRKLAGKRGLTESLVAQIWKEQEEKCAVPNCPYPITATRGDADHFHLDHITPYARGGGNERTNLQILCRTHNKTKSGRDPEVWAKRIGLIRKEVESPLGINIVPRAIQKAPVMRLGSK